MLDQPNGAEKSRATLPPGPSQMLVELVSLGLGAQERRCLEAGVPVEALIEMLLNHSASLAAIVEPPGMRAIVVQEIIDSIPTLVREHVAVRQRTPGGLWLPPGMTRQAVQARAS